MEEITSCPAEQQNFLLQFDCVASNIDPAKFAAVVLHKSLVENVAPARKKIDPRISTKSGKIMTSSGFRAIMEACSNTVRAFSDLRSQRRKQKVAANLVTTASAKSSCFCSTLHARGIHRLGTDRGLLPPLRR